ncbi:hypothetical protein [Paraburkholderia gardini]|uniref:Uncharacterized protein n=1 Tax=Paraburkholderia gardini TaxID=2823469 RepID=A0ABM8U9Q8_9BURK|nr:hypothetical protein [Paraburkholderia gardini]CAG4920286.1 hypothetical protein R54767_04698 [Paraburkholderia gardini]
MGIVIDGKDIEISEAFEANLFSEDSRNKATIAAEADDYVEGGIGVMFPVIRMLKGDLIAALVVCKIAWDTLEVNGGEPEDLLLANGKSFTGGKPISPDNSMLFQFDMSRRHLEMGLDRYADFVMQYIVARTIAVNLTKNPSTIDSLVETVLVDEKTVWQNTGLKPVKVKKAFEDLRAIGLIE